MANESTARGEPVTLGELNGFEIYPMPMFATLAVDDVAVVAAWYEQALGFGAMFRAPGAGGQPSMVHLRRRKYQDILIVASRGASSAPQPTLTLTFNADGDVDALAERARGVEAVGKSEVHGPVETGWNTRDLRVTDPIGHRLIFTARSPNPDPAQAERWKAMFDAARKS